MKIMKMMLEIPKEENAAFISFQHEDRKIYFNATQ